MEGSVHFCAPYLNNPTHRVTVGVIGSGGTGSNVMKSLAKMDFTLRQLGHPGFMVHLYDPDIVSQYNIGRQLFSPSDVGRNKAECVISRINQFFGTDWESIDSLYKFQSYNILISCVDNVKTRVDIADGYNKICASSTNVFNQPYYWLDFGNDQHVGQAILSTITVIAQPKSEFFTVSKLNNVIDIHPSFRDIQDKDDSPSCSTLEALMRQDLFINSTLAELGINILWKLFRKHFIAIHGVYLNLDRLKVMPIKI